MTLKQRLGAWLIPRMPVNRRVFNTIRFEINSIKVRWINRISPKTIRFLREIRTRKHLKLNVGAGANDADGWVNIDVCAHAGVSVAWDIRRNLPFANSQVAKIFAEHVVEHVEFLEDLPYLLEEFYRILESGGRLRIIVPDGQRWLEAYVTDDSEKWKDLGMDVLPDDMPTKMAMINHVFHQGGEHMFAYDYMTLEYVLKRAGFEVITKTSFGDSPDPDICLDTEKHKPYSLYVEAVKSEPTSFGRTVDAG